MRPAASATADHVLPAGVEVCGPSFIVRRGRVVSPDLVRRSIYRPRLLGRPSRRRTMAPAEQHPPLAAEVLAHSPSERALERLGVRSFALAVARAEAFYRWWDRRVAPFQSAIPDNDVWDRDGHYEGWQEEGLPPPRVDALWWVVGLTITRLACLQSRGELDRVGRRGVSEETRRSLRLGVASGGLRDGDPLLASVPPRCAWRVRSASRPRCVRRRRPRCSRGPPADDKDPDPDPDHVGRRRSRWGP